jgi:hypothetical protein
MYLKIYFKSYRKYMKVQTFLKYLKTEKRQNQKNLTHIYKNFIKKLVT